MRNIAVLVSGGGTNLQALIDAQAAGKIPDGRIVRVIASREGVYALERARQHNIPSVVVARRQFADQQAFDAALLTALEACGADLVVLAGFLSILGEAVIARYRNRIINVHPALIPSFCGKGFYGIRPHEAVLKSGVKVTGATVHFVDEVYDHGAIIMQKAVYVKNGDTPEELQHRVMEEAEWQILPKTIDLIAHGRVKVENGIAVVEE